MAYIGNQPGTGVRSRFIFTATASQTTFSGTDDNGKTLSYADSTYVDVYLNGICLEPGTDYTASTKTSVVLTQAASLNDVLKVIAYDVSTMATESIADTGGTFTGDVTFADGAELITASAGTDNVRIGEGSGASIASGGNQNTLIGKDAGAALTTGDNNVAIGFEALKAEDGHGDNVAVGHQALKTLNAGTNAGNTAVGYQAGQAVTTGTGNTLIGNITGDALTVGSNNIAVGYQSLSSDTKGNLSVAMGQGTLLNQNFTSATNTYNTALGHAAGNQITTGYYNTFVGGLAGDGTDDGVENVAVGIAALSANCGNDNVAVGAYALEDNVSTGNTAVGHHALKDNTSAGYNVAVGFGAMEVSTTAGQSVAVGSGALDSHTTGGYNTAVGYNSQTACTTGYSNVSIGQGALQAVTTGPANIAVGNLAGQAHTTNYGSTFVGHYAGYGSTATNNTCLGYLAGYANNGSNQLTSGGGNVLLGSFSDVSASTDGSCVVVGHSVVGKGSNTAFIGGSSGAYQGNNFSTWAQTSDRRLKKNIVDSPIGLAEINQIQVRNFEYKTSDDVSEIEADGLKETDIINKSGVQVGAIAQELQAILPKCVKEESTGVLSLNTDNLTWHLIKAVQELSAKNDALETRLAALEE